MIDLDAAVLLTILPKKKGKKGETMKKIAQLIILAAIIFSFEWGCKENVLTDNFPTSEQISIINGKKPKDLEPVKSNIDDKIIGYKVSESIDGSIGGVIKIHNIERKTEGVVVTTGLLTIPKGAFAGIKDITIITNSNSASIQFYPEMQFDKSLKLTLNYEGLDEVLLDSLGLLNPEQMGFYFVADDGTKELIENEGLLFTLKKGILGVKNAKLNHFSRYCWCK